MLENELPKQYLIIVEDDEYLLFKAVTHMHDVTAETLEKSFFNRADPSRYQLTITEVGSMHWPIQDLRAHFEKEFYREESLEEDDNSDDDQIAAIIKRLETLERTIRLVLPNGAELP